MTESDSATKARRKLSHHHHMKIRWEEFFKSDDDTLAKDATLVEKGSLVGRVGIMLLSCGTGVNLLFIIFTFSTIRISC